MINKPEKIKKEYKWLKILAFFGVIISILIILFAIYITPDYVANNFSSDGTLEPVAILGINIFRIGLSIIGIAGLLAIQFFRIKPSFFSSLQITYRIFLLLLFITINLLIFHFTSFDRFNLNQEANIPTWYSTILLYSVFLCSLLIYLCDDKISKSNYFRQFFWLGFSLFYLFLSLDEAACLHELIDKFTSIKWVYAYAPLAGMFFISSAYYFIIIKKSDRKLRNWILGGLVVYAVGSMVAELISHIFAPLPPLLKLLEPVFEEGLEMIGTIMVLMGCFQELKRLIEPLILVHNSTHSKLSPT